VHGNETFLKHLLVIGVESAPEDGIALSLHYPTCVEQDLALRIELPLVVDNIGLISHVLPGIHVSKFD
jgi:hypothetical protein